MLSKLLKCIRVILRKLSLMQALLFYITFHSVIHFPCTNIRFHYSSFFYGKQYIIKNNPGFLVLQKFCFSSYDLIFLFVYSYRSNIITALILPSSSIRCPIDQEYQYNLNNVIVTLTLTVDVKVKVTSCVAPLHKLWE